jgi:peptide/nickel transport system substrate-binding protein
VAQRSALALVLGLALAGCRHGGTPPAGERTLTLAVRADVTGLYPNPPAVNEAYTFHINANVLEGLVRFDSQLRLVPSLAERWENPDDRTYVFHLREGLRFSDGRPLTAADVAASLTAAREKSWPVRDYLHAVESVTALDERRVVVKTRFPYQILLTKLQWAFVLPAEAVEKNPVPVVGSGPYKVDAWTPGQELRLSRNESFRGPAPAFGRARLQVVPDEKERLAMLLRGDADLATDVPLDAVEALRRRSDLRVLTRGSLRVIFLSLRPDTPPFTDPRVREAIDIALDRSELVLRALAGSTEPATQIVHPSVVGYNPALAPVRVDRARARALLAQAGYPSGFDVRLDGPNNRYVNDTAMLAEVARQLAEIGVRVAVNAIDKVEFFRLIGSGRSGFHLLGWSCESGEAGDVLDAAFRSPAEGFSDSDNSLGLRDAVLDRLIDRSNASITVEERSALLQQAVAHIARLHVALPLVLQAEAVAMKRSIRWELPRNSALLLSEVSPAGPSE